MLEGPYQKVSESVLDAPLPCNSFLNVALLRNVQTIQELRKSQISLEIHSKVADNLQFLPFEYPYSGPCKFAEYRPRSATHFPASFPSAVVRPFGSLTSRP